MILEYECFAAQSTSSGVSCWGLGVLVWGRVRQEDSDGNPHVVSGYPDSILKGV